VSASVAIKALRLWERKGVILRVFLLPPEGGLVLNKANYILLATMALLGITVVLGVGRGSLTFSAESAPKGNDGQGHGATALPSDFDAAVRTNAAEMMEQGKQIFRYDTFGTEAFWGDTLGLHQAIEAAKLGGVGPGVSPKAALAVGLRLTWMRFLQAWSSN
jgi:hypothetical protein